MKKGFFAYSTQSPCCEETIEIIIDKINSGSTVKIESWRKLKTTGKFIITEILSSIGTLVWGWSKEKKGKKLFLI